MVQGLLSSGRPVFYITSDPADPLRSGSPERLEVFFFRRLLPFVVQFLQARAFVLTLTDLHRLHLRRSVFPVKHVYLFHALVSTHMMYAFGAFDHYDTVFCAGPHHIAELRRSEELYKTPGKQLLEVGYPALDRLVAARAAMPALQGKRALIASGWGARNILESCAQEVVPSLLREGFSVTVRPHPEWVKRDPEKLASLRQAWSANPGVTWDLGPLRDQTLLEVDVLITDWSGVALEYAFGTGRPVLFMDVPRKVRNPHYEELGLTPIEVRLRERIGKVLPSERGAEAGGEVQRLLENREAYRARILEERSKSVFHIGRSGQVATEFLLELLDGV